MLANPTNRPRRPAPLKRQQGMLLIEGLIAILIFSVAVLGLVGMQAASIQHVSEAKYRSDASFLAQQMLGRMWVDQDNLAAYAVADAPVSSLPNGRTTISVNGRQVTVTINWQPPGAAFPHRYTTVAQISNDG